jgi:hypothetical protein
MTRFNPIVLSTDILPNQDISVDQVREAIRQHFVPLFDPKSSVVVVASATGLDEKIAAQLSDAGYDVEKMELPSLGDNDVNGSDDDGDSAESSSEDDSDGDAMSMTST